MNTIELLRTLAADDERWRSLVRPLLAILIASQQPVSIGRVIELLGDSPFDEPAVTEALETDLGLWITITREGGDHRYLLHGEELRDLVAEARHNLTDLFGEEFVDLNRRLFRRLLPTTGSGDRDWTSIDEYVAHALPGYAFAGEELEAMMADPGFVQSCALPSILRYADLLHDPNARAAAVALECAAGHGEDRSWWLYIWARKAGANTLSAAIAGQHPEWPLRAVFAIWHGMPSQAIVGSGYLPGVTAFRDRDGRHLLALEADNMTIRTWDPTARKYTGVHFEVAGDWIRSVTAMPIRGRGDVLVVNVDTRAESEAPESGPYEDVQDNTGDDASLVDEDEDEDEDEDPFDDYMANRWSSRKRSVIQFFHSDTGETAYPAIAEFSDLVYEVDVVPTPSSPMLITGGADGQSQIWDPETRQEVGSALKGHGSPMPGVGAVLLEDGTYAAASVRKDGEVILRDPLSGAKLAKPFGRQTGQVVSVAFAPDGSWVAIGGEHMVRIWDPRAAHPIGDPLRFVERSVCVVAPVHLPDGGFAVGIGLIDGRVQIWSVDSGVLLGETEPSHDGPGFDTREIQAICSLNCPGGPFVVAAGKKRGVRIWSTTSILGEIQQNGRSDVTALAVMPVEAGDPVIACAYSGGLLELTDAATGTVIRSLDVSPGKSVVSLATGLRDGQSLVAAVTEGELVLVNAMTAKVVGKHPLGWFPGTPQIVLSPDGGSLVIAIFTYLYVLNLVTEGELELRPLAELPYAIEAMTFLPHLGQDAVVAATVADGTIHRVRPGTGDKLEPFPSLGRERPAALCAGILRNDRHVLILVDVTGTVFVLDPSAGTLLREPHRTGCRTRSATAYVHDQQLVVALGGFDGTVLLVDVEQGSEVARGQGHLDSVTHMTILTRTDGPLVISAGADGSVLAWESSLRRSPLYEQGLPPSSLSQKSRLSHLAWRLVGGEVVAARCDLQRLAALNLHRYLAYPELWHLRASWPAGIGAGRWRSPLQGRPLMARIMSATALRTAARSLDSVPVRARRTTITAVTATISMTPADIRAVSSDGSMMPPALSKTRSPDGVRSPGLSTLGQNGAVILSCDGGWAGDGVRAAGIPWRGLAGR